jgi:replicative superfamily II helicase
MNAMTKGEREDLIRLIKQREKVAKTAAEQRSAAMLAQFEQQVSAIHAFATNDVWRASVEAATAAAQQAMEKIATESDRLGIPKEFQPRVSFSWLQRGENAYNERRVELRRVAKAEIDAMEKVARVQIEQASVQAQTEVIANGLTSAAAIEFLRSMPAIDTMMPALDITTIQAKLAERARNSRPYGGPHLIE